MSIYSPLVTLGLDPELSKVATLGYGPEVSVEVTVVSTGAVGKRGRSGRKREELDRLIRIRVIDEDGKAMMAEQIVEESKLKKITFSVNENFTITGSDIYVKIKDLQIKENTPTIISVSAHEAKKRQILNS